MTSTHPNGQPPKGQPAKPPAPTEELRQIPKQTPRNALGEAARSDLVVASIVAGFGFVLLFAGLTFGPYFWNKSQGTTQAAPTAPEKPDAPPAGPPVAPPPSTPDPAAKGPATGTPVAGKQPGKDDILNKLGENGTKVAPAKVNPLDKKEDDILNSIGK